MSARRDTAPLPPLVRACVEAGYGTPARPLAAELFRRHPKLMGRHGLDGPLDEVAREVALRLAVRPPAVQRHVEARVELVRLCKGGVAGRAGAGARFAIDGGLGFG